MTIPDTSDAMAWLSLQGGAMEALLETLVNIDSGSRSPEGVARVCDAIQGFLEGNGIATDRFGDCHLAATVPGRNRAARRNDQDHYVLMGHMDTVFPDGEAERRPFRREGGRGYGPGVADMKAGLVMNAFLLVALSRSGGLGADVTALFTGDEEIGSPLGRDAIRAKMANATLALNAEPGRANGNVVSSRKGAVFLRMKTTGKAAHSGGAFEHGISAIEELSRKVGRIHALTDLGRGVTLNVGLFRGGQSINTVAPNAECEIDFRFAHPQDRAVILGQLAAIAAEVGVPGTATTLEEIGDFLPMTESAGGQRLLAHYLRAAADEGIAVGAEMSGGCSDSGFVDDLGIPVVCATGPVGGYVHTADEYVELDTFTERARIACLTLMRVDADAKDLV